jgi:hypothetical protein
MLCADPLHPFQNGRTHGMALGTLLICVVLCWAAQASAQNCADIFTAIKKEAMYCGFFCDQERIRPLQRTYETNCISFIVPPSLFDLDSLPHDPIPETRRNDMTAKGGDAK